jgi:hypothetical protein
MFAGLLALAMLFQAPPAMPLGVPLRVSWNQSPSGAGSARIAAWQGCDIDGNPDFASATGGNWCIPFDEKNCIYVYTDSAGSPQVSVNTSSAVVGSDKHPIDSPVPGPGFILTESTSAPFKMTWTASNPRTAGLPLAWVGGGDITITLTSP